MGVATETKPWTLAELQRLPDDGNKYELVYGELFVTPAPSPSHEEVISILVRLLNPYVERWKIGRVYTARAIVRALESEVEPDIMVRPVAPLSEDWAKIPVPVFVIEIASSSTRRRDREQKRRFYLEVGVADYWIVDRQSRSIQVVRPNVADRIEYNNAVWQPARATQPFIVDVRALFAEALSER